MGFEMLLWEDSKAHKWGDHCEAEMNGGKATLEPW